MKICLCFIFLLFPLSLVTSNASAATFVDTSHGSIFTCNSACHVVHGAAGSTLLGGADAELTCLTCHGPAGISVLKAATHNPPAMPAGEKITCLECHNPHANRANYLGGTNTQLIGIQFDYNATPAVEYPLATIREETSSGLGVAKDVVFVTNNDFARVGGDGPCQACHAAGPVSGPTALKNHQWGDCTVCHAHDDNFARRQCVECHDSNAPAAVGAPPLSVEAPKVLDKAGGSAALIGGHLQSVFGEVIVGLTDLQWTVQCIKCHTGHSGDVFIPNNVGVGIDYQKTGGIGLGGSVTLPTATSEAGICWDCHTPEGISEWGTTTSDTNGAFPNFNYGSLNQDNWVGATWTSANFQYKTNLIQSTHAANATGGVAGVDAVGDIRCSYCHDVHDLNAANGDTFSGSPYLRGSWMGNPYREDGAPRWDAGGDQHSYAENQTFGAVPRGNRGPYTSHYRTTQAPNDAFNFEMGGYWIDQNSGFPTRDAAYDTATETAGLCELCHGDGDGSWADTEIDSIDEFVGNNWFGTNGHANSVISGSGTVSGSSANIFTNSLRGNALTSVTADGLGERRAYTNTGGMGYFGWTSGSRLWGVRNNNEKSWYVGAVDAGTGVFPVAENPQQFGDARRAFHSAYGSGFEWGNWWVSTDPDVTQNNTTTDDRYHQFTCSKCHNPHASRLPRLMISNCLDVRNNTWDDQTTFEGRQGYSGDSDWTTSGINYTSMVQSPGSQELAYSISAQNCHRAVDATTGWNTITPPNSPSGAWP